MSTDPQPLAWHDLQNCLRRSPVLLLAAMKKWGPQVMVAGGYVRATVAGEDVNDIDVFVPSKDIAKAVALYIAEGDGKYVHETDNAYTITLHRIPIQIVHRWTFDHPLKAIESFDFTVSRAAFWCEIITTPDPLDATKTIATDHKWRTVADPRFYADLAAKRLIYCSPIRNEDAGGSLLRVLKYYQRGYRIPLDSMGAVLARLMMGVRMEYIEKNSEAEWYLPVETKMAAEITKQLREVDPDLDPKHIAHLPAETPRSANHSTSPTFRRTSAR